MDAYTDLAAQTAEHLRSRFSDPAAYYAFQTIAASGAFAAAFGKRSTEPDGSLSQHAARSAMTKALAELIVMAHLTAETYGSARSVDHHVRELFADALASSDEP